jgi:putative ABC transport system permease protein
MPPFKLVRRNLTRHFVRTLLTTSSITVAVLLLCVLQGVLNALTLGIERQRDSRLIVQSAVSLFVDLPLSYQPKIENVDGVERVCKWQWFGGYYQDPGNFFAQFAVDPENFVEMYPELELVEGSWDDFVTGRRSCLIGAMLAGEFGWEVGDTIPLIGGIFPHPDGNDVPWEFRVAAIYDPTTDNFDKRAMFFQWEYFQQTMEVGQGVTPGTGTYVLRTEPGADAVRIMSAVDEMFAGGPQRVQTTTEAEFQSQFVTMLGNVPFFLNSIGTGVLIAVLLACVNTMLMAAREQTHDVGILKALGFTDGGTFGLLLSQSLVISLTGGLLGIALALITQPLFLLALGAMFPNYAIGGGTLLFGFATAVGVGLIAGIVPAVTASRLKSVDALRAE